MEMDVSSLEDKLEAVGYGFFIPLFFVSSGMGLDVRAIADPLRLLIFFGLLLVVRGLPALVVDRHALPRRQRIEMTFITATTMPLIALAEIGLRDGVMVPANAAAIAGAGVLPVLVYPPVAAALAGRGRKDPACRPVLPGRAPPGQTSAAWPASFPAASRPPPRAWRSPGPRRCTWWQLPCWPGGGGTRAARRW